jgi:ADP-ribose pyrophosphatase YjhB (NUDIX family)
MLRWLLRIWRLLPYPLRMAYLRVRYGRFGVGLSALIQDEGGRVLLVRRTYSRDEPWALPGGWLEGSDKAIDAALERELREETGLRVRIGRVRAIERAGFAVVLLFDVELLDVITAFRPSEEVSEVAFFDLGRIQELSPFNGRLLERVLHGSDRVPEA